MSRRSSNLFGTVVAFVAGAGLMTFLNKKKGKDLRKELMKSWEGGENIYHAKMRIFGRELLEAIEEIKPAYKEFMKSPKTKAEIKKGKKEIAKAKKVVKKKVVEGKKEVKKTVKKGKKEAAKKLREVSGLDKK